ncbi:hypothetical protein JW758_01450 [Candidatus Peregrinibacteria bacterium]|nr:hypothetical protein [Candidatus Peregrinibacteria bacterium]
MSDIIGRKGPRIYTDLMVPGETYAEFDTTQELEDLHSKIRLALQDIEAKETIYDEDATAYGEKGKRYRRRMEPVMLHRFVAQFEKPEKRSPKGENPVDKIGLRVILKGCGEIRDMVEALMLTKGHELIDVNEEAPTGDKKITMYDYFANKSGVVRSESEL